jgi:hypothetical protein
MTTMTKPSQALIWMGGFLIAVGLLASLVATRLIENFQANPFFNGVILAVLVFGVFVNVRQVLLLARDVEWIELFKRSPPDRPLPIKAETARADGAHDRHARARRVFAVVGVAAFDPRQCLPAPRGIARLVALSRRPGDLPRPARHVLGSARDDPRGRRHHRLARGRRRSGRDVHAAEGKPEAAAVGHVDEFFDSRCSALPARSFSAFLDLQAGHAQNRFYNELEEWLSGVTKLSSGGLHTEGETSVPAYVQALLEQTADGLERMQRALTDSERERRQSSEQFAELNTQLSRLADLMGRESREIRGMAETQEELKNVLKTLAAAPNGGARLSTTARRAAPAVADDCCCCRWQACLGFLRRAFLDADYADERGQERIKQNIRIMNMFYPLLSATIRVIRVKKMLSSNRPANA